MRKLVGNKNNKKQEFSQSLIDNDHYELHGTSPTAKNTNNNVPFESNPMRSQQQVTIQPAPSPAGRVPAPRLPSRTVSRRASKSEFDFQKYFLPEEGYTWDFCIVVPNPSFYQKQHEQEEEKLRAEGKPIPSVSTLNPNKVTWEDIMERLQIAGLQTYCFQSGDGDELYIKIRAPLTVLRRHANQSEFKLLYDPKMLREKVDKKYAPIADDPEITSLTPYQFIYGPYVDEKRELFANAHNLSHPFSPIVRIKLIMDIITSDEKNCCSLNLRKVTRDGPSEESTSVLSYFPLHDDPTRDQLQKIWLNWKVKPWEQPIDEVKEYLGEKVALYFEFVGHYTTWLLSLSIAGFCVALDVAVEAGIYNSLPHALLLGYTIPFYCIFVSFWSQLMIEFWKRREARKSMEWGQSDFEETQSQRPEFKGLPTPSVVDGKMIKFFDSQAKNRKQAWSFFVISMMILLVIVCVSGIFGLQFYINSDVDDDSNKSSGNTAVSIFSAIQIVVLNSIYQDMAIGLTDNENHRTDTEYDDALIGKLFAFSFINSYASLFFIAYIKSNLGEACQGPCMYELAYQLTILLISKMTIEKVTNYVTIKINKYVTYFNEVAEYREAFAEGRTVYEPSKLEIEQRLEAYDPSLGVLMDYSQIFIQFGFVTLFVAACPVAPILGYFGNQIEIRGDGYKLLYDMKRTIPTGCEDIGTWLVILQMTAVISVVTNAGILCFTMQLIEFTSWGQVWLFIGFQYTIFILMAVFSWAVPDVPEEVEIQLQRQNYLRDRAAMSDDDRAEENAQARGGQKPVQTQLNQSIMEIHDFDEENPTNEATMPEKVCVIC